MFRLSSLLAVLLCLAGCAMQPPRVQLGDLPVLRLTPAGLGRELALQQRLQVSVGENTQSMDALLEVDSQELRLAVQALGQSALTLHWDGKSLREERADWLPPTLSGERVLFDLQLVFWPAEAIRTALPGDWTLREAAGTRQLWQRDTMVASVEYPADNEAVLTQLRDHYRLQISSAPSSGAAP